MRIFTNPPANRLDILSFKGLINIIIFKNLRHHLEYNFGHVPRIEDNIFKKVA